jgi:nucleoside-diphosphate-sugar epimerase
MPKALVTGANGFIGSHLVRELLDRGYEVNCLVRQTSDISSLRGLPVALLIGDVQEPATLIEPVKNVDYVYHLAAELMVTSRDEFEHANTQGTINLLGAAEKHAAGTLKRFLFVSSQAAAGPGKDRTPLDETALPQPISWYGTSKKQAEEAVKAFADRLRVTIVRPSSVYGEREKDIRQTFGMVGIRLQPKLGIKKKYLVMVYVGDLVRGIVEAAESNSTVNQTYFLNHPEVLTSKDVIKTIARAMDKGFGLMLPVPLFILRLIAPFTELLHHFSRNRPQMTRDKAREVAQRFWIADPSKAKRDFGWEAKATFLDGMKKTIPAYRAEKSELSAMPLEKGIVFWLKYLLSAIFVGVIFETISCCGRFYEYHPWWAVFVIILGAYGFGLGTVAMLLRKTGALLHFFIGTILAGAVELMNHFKIIPYIYWEFAANWPFGITNVWVNSIVLGTFGGIFIIIVGAIMRLLYKRRLRLG